ncbi:MAG: hypothetical protein Q7U38_07920, partial [Methylobacter sp.]|nr:hypothetical protein [Methylobacter sp.]
SSLGVTTLKLCLQGNIKQSLKHCIPKLELGNEKDLVIITQSKQLLMRLYVALGSNPYGTQL